MRRRPAAMDVAVDALVCGGGPAGSAAAIVLARQGISVLIAERSRGQEFKVGECLPPSARPILANLGAADCLENAKHLDALGVLSAWGRTTLSDRSFCFS